jgi:hypothetical protein
LQEVTPRVPAAGRGPDPARLRRPRGDRGPLRGRRRPGHAVALGPPDLLRSKLNLVGRETAQLRQRVSSLVGTVGLTRYDAFPDVGGQLSYSAAFLDEAGDGVVLTAINGRAETRSYAKPVRGGRSDHNLSDEERAAITLAMDATNPNPVSPVR